MGFIAGIVTSILGTVMLKEFSKLYSHNKKISFNYDYNLKVFRAIVDIIFDMFQTLFAVINIFILINIYKIEGDIGTLIFIAPIIYLLLLITFNIITHIIIMHFAKERFKFKYINDMEKRKNNKRLYKAVYTKLGIVFKILFIILINFFFIINAMLNKSIPILFINNSENINIHITSLLLAMLIIAINSLRYLCISDDVGVYKINGNKKILVHIKDDKDIEINTTTNVIIDEQNNIFINGNWYDKEKITYIEYIEKQMWN